MFVGLTGHQLDAMIHAAIAESKKYTDQADARSANYPIHMTAAFIMGSIAVMLLEARKVRDDETEADD
jgi:hypothetical protein